MKPKKLTKQEFEKSFQKVPRLAVNLLISDPQGRILLTKRSQLPFSGY